jgi:transposase
MAQGGRRKFDQDFRDGAVRIVEETGKPVAQVARELGVNEGTLGNWVNVARRRRSGNGVLTEEERAELVRLRRENAELQMRCDVLKRSLALWVGDSRTR